MVVLLCEYSARCGTVAVRFGYKSVSGSLIFQGTEELIFLARDALWRHWRDGFSRVLAISDKEVSVVESIMDHATRRFLRFTRRRQQDQYAEQQAARERQSAIYRSRAAKARATSLAKKRLESERQERLQERARQKTAQLAWEKAVLSNLQIIHAHFLAAERVLNFITDECNSQT